MLTIGAMTAAFAEILEDKPGKIAKFVRELREAGLISTGARGVHAPLMTPLDASSLLVALTATDRPSEAVEKCIALNRLQATMRMHPWERQDAPESLVLEIRRLLVSIAAGNAKYKKDASEYASLIISSDSQSAKFRGAHTEIWFYSDSDPPDPKPINTERVLRGVPIVAVANIFADEPAHHIVRT
jgi:hypothetical protein